MNERLVTTNGPAWMKVSGVFLLLSFAGMVWLTMLLSGEMGALPAIVTMLPSVLVLALGVVLLTAAVRVRVDDDLELRFVPIWHRRLDYSELASVDVVDQSWFRFGGVGLRWRGNATGLILGDRPAVRLCTRSGREYVVQCEDPAGVAAAIQQRLEGRRRHDTEW